MHGVCMMTLPAFLDLEGRKLREAHMQLGLQVRLHPGPKSSIALHQIQVSH